MKEEYRKSNTLSLCSSVRNKGIVRYAYEIETVTWHSCEFYCIHSVEIFIKQEDKIQIHKNK